MALTLSEAAAIAGVPEQQLLVWASLGTGPRCSGNPYRPRSMAYERSEVESWLRAVTGGPQNG